MSNSNYIHLDGVAIIRETDKAFLIRLADADGGEELWIPRSQVADADGYSEGDEDCNVSVSEWWAKQNGIEM